MHADFKAMTDRLWLSAGWTPGKSVLQDVMDLATRLSRCDRADPEDTAGDALAHLLKQTEANPAPFFDDDGAPSLADYRPWATRVLVNRMRDRLRAQRRAHRGRVEDYDLADHPARQSGPLETPRFDLEDAQTLRIRVARKVLLLRAILACKLRERRLHLASLSEFSRGQISACLPYQPDAQTKARGRFKALLAGTTPASLARELIVASPYDDIPLATPERPLLSQAIADLQGAQGTALLRALLEPDLDSLELAFFPRLAGFWDCVVATATQAALLAQRAEVTRGATQLERALREEGRPGREGRGEGLETGEGDHASDPKGRRSQETAMTFGEDRWELEGVLTLAQEEPSWAVSLLMSDPDLRRDLALGRARRGDAQAVLGASRSPSAWLESLLSKALSWMDGLTPMVGIPLPIRSGAEAPAQAPRPWTFPPSIARLGARHCALVSLEGESLRCLYPALPGDPTRALELAGESPPIPLPERGSDALLLITTDAPLPARLRDGPAPLSHWEGWLSEEKSAEIWYISAAPT